MAMSTMTPYQKPMSASDPYQKSDIGFEEMGQISQANPQAGRIAESQKAGEAVSGADRYFDQYRQAEKNTAAVNSARTQLGQMADTIKFKSQNFDEGEATKNQLSQLSQGASKAYVDAEMEFQTDKAGRQFLSERQIEDFMNMKGAKNEDWQNYSNTATLESDRRMQLLDAAYKKISSNAAMAEQTFKEGVNKDTQEYIAKAQAALKQKEESMKKSNGRRGVMISAFSAVGTGAGAIVGGIYGGPVGAMAGATAGGIAGTYAGGAVANATNM